MDRSQSIDQTSNWLDWCSFLKSCMLLPQKRGLGLHADSDSVFVAILAALLFFSGEIFSSLGWIWSDFQHQSSIRASKVSCFFCNLACFPQYCVFFVASSCEWCVEGRGGVCICFSTGICFLTKWWCSLKSGVGCCRHLGTQRAEMVVMKNCGHAPQIENPREFNRIILNFLQSPAEKSTKDWSGSDWLVNPVISAHKFSSISQSENSEQQKYSVKSLTTDPCTLFRLDWNCYLYT